MNVTVNVTVCADRCDLLVTNGQEVTEWTVSMWRDSKGTLWFLISPGNQVKEAHHAAGHIHGRHHQNTADGLRHHSQGALQRPVRQNQPAGPLRILTLHRTVWQGGRHTHTNTHTKHWHSDTLTLITQKNQKTFFFLVVVFYTKLFFAFNPSHTVGELKITVRFCATITTFQF